LEINSKNQIRNNSKKKMRRIILFSISLLIISCNDLKKKNNKVVGLLPNSEMENFSLSDSLFIGIPLVKDPFFIKNIVDGFEHPRL
jgi:hypothetical protein